MKDIKIVIATHKQYCMPKDQLYLPLQVGAAIHENLEYTKDDSIVDNISAKNSTYCELTGLYWLWKKLDNEYVGLVHYRRYFVGKRRFKGKYGNIITSEELDGLLNDYELLLPKKRHYFIETNKSQYLHSHHHEGYYMTEKAIDELYPEYKISWNKVMKKRSGHRFNMFIMKKSLLNDYCEWLFNILSYVEKNVDISTWSKSEQRIYGYLSERLFDVWIDKNNIKYKNIPYKFIEKQNWTKKILKFIIRKFRKSRN